MRYSAIGEAALTAFESYRISIDDLKDRAKAAFLGFAIGDALGATAEFMTPSEIRAAFGVLKDIQGGGWLHLPAGAVTDDTEMSLCLARSLVAKGFSAIDIAEHFTAWLKSRPRDVGGTCRRGIRRFIADRSICAPPSDMDAGNGAAMRVVPVALATVGDSELLANWAITQAHITHHHRLSDAACVVLGQMLHLALVGHGKTRLEALVRDFLLNFPVFGYSGSDVQSSAYIVDTLRTVLKAFLRTHNFEDCVITTVNWGGDADTTGAIAGALAGAYYGLGEIPERWVRRLDSAVRREVEQLSLELVALSPAVRSQRPLVISRTFLTSALALCQHASTA